MKLTIAIPTYDRNEVLKETLRYLLPQITDSCRLIILDNFSPAPVSVTLEDTFKAYPNLNFKIIRNRTNIGASSNILRCFEVCTTEWLWVLGDDDIVSSEAVQTIFHEINRNGDKLYLGFAPPSRKRDKDLVATGLNDFLSKVDSFNSINFTSSGVVRVPAVINNLNKAIMYGGYSMMPFAALIVSSIGDSGVCLLSKKTILKQQAVFSSQDTRWSPMNQLFGITTFIDMPMSYGSRQLLAKKLLADIAKPELIVMSLVVFNLHQTNRKVGMQFYDVIRKRISAYNKCSTFCFRMSFCFRMRLYRPLVRYPSFAWWVFKTFLMSLRPEMKEKIQRLISSSNLERRI